MCSVQVPKFMPKTNDIKCDDIPHNPNAKKIIIIHTKDIKEDDLKLLGSHGVYDLFSDKYININVDEIFKRRYLDYFLIDVREENGRYFFNTIKNKKDYFIVALISRFEKYTQLNDDLQKFCDSIMYKLPDKPIAFAEMFNNSLVENDNLVVPNKATSLLCFLCSIGEIFKRKSSQE